MYWEIREKASWDSQKVKTDMPVLWAYYEESRSLLEEEQRLYQEEKAGPGQHGWVMSKTGQD